MGTRIDCQRIDNFARIRPARFLYSIMAGKGIFGSRGMLREKEVLGKSIRNVWKLRDVLVEFPVATKVYGQPRPLLRCSLRLFRRI